MSWSSHSFGTLRLARRLGSVMFSSAVSVGTRLNDWNTKPMWSRRSSVSSRSESRPRSTSPNTMRPPLRVSSPARQCISVDLPEPDGPITAVNRPLSMARSTPARARTSVRPLPYTFTAASARTATAVAVLGASVVVIVMAVPPVDSVSFVLSSNVRTGRGTGHGATRRRGGGENPTLAGTGRVGQRASRR